MAEILGGDIIEITYNHPTIGTGTFSVKAGEDASMSTGGVRTNDDASSVTSNGRNIKILNVQRWWFSLGIGWDLNDADELEVCSQLAADPIDSVFTFDHIGHSVRTGSGSIVGDLEGNSQSASIALKFSGGGRLTKL